MKQEDFEVEILGERDILISVKLNIQVKTLIKITDD